MGCYLIFKITQTTVTLDFPYEGSVQPIRTFPFAYPLLIILNLSLRNTYFFTTTENTFFELTNPVNQRNDHQTKDYPKFDQDCSSKHAGLIIETWYGRGIIWLGICQCSLFISAFSQICISNLILLFRLEFGNWIFSTHSWERGHIYIG